MHRRTVLRAVGAAGLAGLSATSGCLGALDGAFGRDGPGWRHGVGGWVDAVESGLVLGREVTDDRGVFDLGGGDGSVFALDAATGEREWSYGETGAYSFYTAPTVDGGIFFGLGDDAGGSGNGAVYALDVDGTERWTRDVGSVYHPPRVADGVVYAGSDDYVVRAFDAEDGEVLWSADGFGDDPEVVGVADAVIVAAGGLIGLDPDDGHVRWRCDVPGVPHMATLADGVAYAASESLVAVRDGERLWQADVDGVLGTVAAGHVFARAPNRAVAVDAANGEVAWRSERTDLWFAVGGGTLYVAGDRLSAVDVGNWTEHWSRPLGGSRARRVATDAGGRVAYVATEDETVHAFATDGERDWQRTVDSPVESAFVEDRLYLGTRESLYAFSPESGDESAATDGSPSGPDGTGG